MAVGPAEGIFADVVREVLGAVALVNYAERSSFETKWGPFHVGARGFHVKDGASGCVLMKFMPKKGVRQTHRADS